MSAVFKLYKPFFIFTLASLLALSLSRITLIIWQHNRIEHLSDYAFIILQGIRFDLVIISMFIILPITAAPLLSRIKYIQPGWNLLVRIYLSVLFLFLLFLEISTPPFILQFDLRPNYLFFEYLEYPKEVLSTLWAAYKAPMLIALIAMGVLGKIIYKKLKQSQQGIQPASLLAIIIATPVIFLLCGILGRSTFDHRAVNPSTVAFSSDPLLNTLSMSSAYSSLYDFYEKKNELANETFYGELSNKDVINIIKANMRVDKSQFTSTEIPTLHKQQAFIKRNRPLNLVIILEESLGAEFVGSLGGLNLTPNLDNLAKQGIWFENMFATGTRSVRGIEAVIASYPPTPSRSVVKLPRSQTNFFTIARLLTRHNYDTSFIYGGEAHFDNMKRFFANNGFKNFIDQSDFDKSAFHATWGVSDEDLFNKAHKKLSAYNSNQPFFSLIFTSTNHSPFEFPDGRITLHDKEKYTVNNAVKYTDYALGEFIKKARKSNYWKNTLFLVVADHNSRVYGSELVPIKRFHIPALILGADIPAIQVKPVASQIDLLPTILSLMGLSSEHPAIGHDLSRNILEHDNTPGRAMMQFNQTFAYMEDKHVVLMQKDKPTGEYTYNGKVLVPNKSNNKDLRKKALAHAIWPMTTYKKLHYRLPAKK